jgi:hypothetical protein
VRGETIAVRPIRSSARPLLGHPLVRVSRLLDDTLVSHALAKLGTAIDAVLTTVNVRHELQQAGLAVEHLTDEQVSELGRRVVQAASPGIRS